MQSGRTILVVDDKADARRSVRTLLEGEGHRVLTAESGARALALLARAPAHLLIVDSLMPIMSGELLVRAVRARDPLVQIVLQTGYAETRPSRDMLGRLQILGYHDRGDGPEHLLALVDLALATHDRLTRLACASEALAACEAALRGDRPADELPAHLHALACVLRELDGWPAPAPALAPAPTATAFARRLRAELPEILRTRLALEPAGLAVHVAPGLPDLHGDAGRLAEALADLLAPDATEGPIASPTRRVEVDVRHDAWELIVTVTDHDGVAPTDLGVAMACCLVNADFGGTLVVEGTASGDPVCTIRLPLPGAPPRPEALPTATSAPPTAHPVRPRPATKPVPQRATGGRRA